MLDPRVMKNPTAFEMDTLAYINTRSAQKLCNPRNDETTLNKTECTRCFLMRLI